jgi:hypothetical protein
MKYRNFSIHILAENIPTKKCGNEIEVSFPHIQPFVHSFKDAFSPWP